MTAHTDTPGLKAEQAYMWAITYRVGQKGDRRHFYTSALRYRRDDCIRDWVKLVNRPWAQLRKEGDRCVRVLVTEV